MGASLGQDNARTLYQPAFACELEVVGDEGRVEYHVAVDKDDVVAFCLRQRAVARFGGAEAVVRPPRMFDGDVGVAAGELDDFGSVLARTVVSDELPQLFFHNLHLSCNYMLF